MLNACPVWQALSSLELGLSTQQVQQLVLVLGFDGDDGKGDGSVAQQRDAGGEPCVDLEKYLKRLALVADHSVIARSEQELLDLLVCEERRDQAVVAPVSMKCTAAVIHAPSVIPTGKPLF